MSYLFPAIGAAVAMAGGDKLAGLPAYEGMFNHLGWSHADMELAAAAELAGGLLMMPRSTRPLGGALVALASAAVFTSEMQHGDRKLAVPRGLILVAAVAAVVSGLMRPRQSD